MNTQYFYGKLKTYPNANKAIEESDESAFSDSDVTDEDPDYLPQTRPSTSYALQEDNFSSEDLSDNDGTDVDSLSILHRRSPAWRHIQNDPGADNNIPKSKSTLPVSDSIKAPFQYFEYFFDNKLLDRIVLETNLYGVQKNSNKTS